MFRVLGFLLVIGLIAGAGMISYKAGMAHGVMQAPAVAAAIEKAAEDGQALPPLGYSHGYAPSFYSYGMRGHGFSPFGALCGSIFFLFLFFGFMKMLFFRRMRHGWGFYPHASGFGDWNDQHVPPMFQEWHKRAHGERAAEGEADKKE